MTKLKVFSTFTGVGGFDLPFHNHKDFEVIGMSENDKYCNAVLRYNFPEVKNYGDITKLEPKSIPDFDILIGGSPCFVAGTLIQTKTGLTSIEDVKIGDTVLTHDGTWQVVTDWGYKDAPTRKISGMGFLPTITTDEHPFYIRKKYRKWDNSIRRAVRLFSEPSWVNAVDINPREDFCGQVLPQEEDSNYTPEQLWVFGRFLADGWTKKRYGRKVKNINGFIICCGKHELEELRSGIEAANFHYTLTEEGTVYKFTICDTKTAIYLSTFGSGASNKEVPTSIISLPKHKCDAFLSGYLSGDGYKRSETEHGCTTVSRKMVLGLSVLVHKVHGVAPSMHVVPVPPTTVIEGRTVNQKTQYHIRFRLKSRNTKSHCEGIYVWKPIKENKETGKIERVYNIQVAESSSYIANGAIVHNCQNLSIAGNREGLHGEQSRLFFEYIKILKCKKPTYFIWENVSSALTSRRGWDFARVQVELFNAGYSFRWEVLSATEFGIPQIRERVFIVGCLRGRGSRKIFCEEGYGPDNVGKTTIKNEDTKKIVIRNEDNIEIKTKFNCIDANYHKGLDNHRQRSFIAYSKSTRKLHYDHRMRLNDNANTLNTGDGCTSQSTANFILESDSRLRKLMPTECERLMSWPSEWTKYGIDESGNKIEISNTQRYSMAGNGVVSVCVNPIRDLILKNEKRRKKK